MPKEYSQVEKVSSFLKEVKTVSSNRLEIMLTMLFDKNRCTLMALDKESETSTANEIVGLWEAMEVLRYDRLDYDEDGDVIDLGTWKIRVVKMEKYTGDYNKHGYASNIGYQVFPSEYSKNNLLILKKYAVFNNMTLPLVDKVSS